MSETPAERAYRMGSGRMFDNIADRYDRLNRIISMGVDQSWRRKTVASLEIQDGHRVLDLATGTADLAIQIADTHPGCEVVGVDPSVGMLEVGRGKLDERSLGRRITLLEGDAQSLPFDPDSFDSACIAFGIRNVPDRDKGLAEMVRVVRPGGRIAILELSEPEGGIIAPFARFHIRQVVPRLGAWLSGSEEYRYLQQSIAAFPPPREFAEQIERAGGRMVALHELTFGVCCLYVAEVPPPDEGAGARG